MRSMGIDGKAITHGRRQQRRLIVADGTEGGGDRS
jgi:hypothetical protein